MAIYPNEVWPGDAAIELLDGTTDVLTGLPYIAKGTGPTSVPSLEIQYNRREQRLAHILASWRQGMVVDEGNLHIGDYPLVYTQAGTHRSFVGASGVSVPTGVVKVVYLNSTSDLVVADSWPSDITSYVPLAVVDTTVTPMKIDDYRTTGAFSIPALDIGNVRDRRMVTAYCASVGASQSDVQIFAYDPPEDLTLAEVQVFCTAVTSTASVNVKENGTSVLSAPGAPSAGTIVKPTISDANISNANNVTIHVTTNGSGSIANLTVTMLFKAMLSS